MKKFDLHTYQIYFDGVQSSLSKLLEETSYSTLFVLVDENTRQHCLPLVQEVLPSDTKYVDIVCGELNKNLKTCQDIWSVMLKQGADRQSLMINLGGGVIGDMGGFCASTFMRGMRFVQIPTTLLSQVDASVGSKLGIDFQGVKNIIGLFNDPIAVLIDSSFLNTLPISELRSGYAEVIKHALIYDAELWKELQTIKNIRDVDSWDQIIHRSVEIKKEIVEQDRKETSLRKILNFGHTIGHALESYFLETDTPLLHGEAIAWGMYFEGLLSTDILTLSTSDLEQIKNVIQQIYGDKYPPHFDADAMIEYMRKDKKNVHQKISFSLLDRIGHCVPDQFVGESRLRKFLEKGDLL